jgi:hypothetical protein
MSTVGSGLPESMASLLMGIGNSRLFVKVIKLLCRTCLGSKWRDKD